jgi:hypothetical protein
VTGSSGYAAMRGIYSLPTPTSLPHPLGRHASPNVHPDCAASLDDTFRCACTGSRPQDRRCCAYRQHPGGLCAACAEFCGSVPPKPPFPGRVGRKALAGGGGA